MRRNPPRESLPIIELGAPAAHHDADLAAHIHAAATTTGFFYLAAHGIDPALAEQAMRASREFFASPAALKAEAGIDDQQRGWMADGGATMHGASEADLKEVFFFGPAFEADDTEVRAGLPLCAVNRWPPAMPALRERVWPYYSAVMTCGQRLLALFARALGLSDDFFAQRYRRPLGRAQLIRYPPQPAGAAHERYGVAPHTDFGCITLLLQDDNGGLEVRRRDGEWMPVPPITGTLVVNIGDLLARWSNDRFASTPHRVVNRAPHQRHSIAVFCDPTSDAIIDPRDMPLPAGATPRYEPIGAGAYIAERNRGAFAHYARAGVERTT